MMVNVQNYKGKMIKGAIGLTISGVIVKILGLIYKIPLSYILSDEGMGYFNSAYTVYTLFYLICTAGIPKAISIMVSEARSEGMDKRVRDIYKTAITFFTILGLIITVLFVFTARPISKAIGNSQAYFTMIAVAPSIMFTCISGVMRGYFNGSLKFFPIALSEACSGVIRLVLGLSFAYTGYRLGFSLATISALTILGTTVGSFSGFFCLFIYKRREGRHSRKEYTNSLSLGSPNITKRLLRLSIPITLTATVGSISSIVDLVVIMKRLQSIGFTEFQSGVLYGNYTTLAIPMLNLIGTLIVPLTTVLLPFVSKDHSKAPGDILSEKISFVIEILSFLILPAIIIFTFRAEEVLTILFDDTSATMAAPLLMILGPGMLFMSLSSVLNTTLEGMGNTKVPLIGLLVGAIAKTLLSIYLIGNEKFEILGAPIGTAVSYMISLIITLYYVKFVKKLDIRITSKILPSLICSLFAILISGVIRFHFLKENVLFYAVEMVIFAVVYVLSFLLIKSKCLLLNFYRQNKQNKLN